MVVTSNSPGDCARSVCIDRILVDCIPAAGHRTAEAMIATSVRTEDSMYPRQISRAALVAALLAATLVAHAQPRGPAREIIPLTGDLYRARNGNWYAIFLVTPDGIILGDPINPAFAAWLKSELTRRFPVPVRYVVYSHSHFDHAAGG